MIYGIGGTKMSKDMLIILGIAAYIVTVTAITVALNFLNKRQKDVYYKQITELERDKNLIISASIMSELNKIQPLMNNELVKQAYDNFVERFEKIKNEDVAKITDMLVDVEELYNDKNYKELKEKLNKTELEIYYAKTKANTLLEEIKEITLSEERNRETITKLKASYREILRKYHDHKNEYQLISSPIELQFENVDKFFSAFEVAMEKNSFQEVGKIVKAIDDLVGNLKLVIEESPTIITLGRAIIPKKIDDIKAIATRMEKNGFNLDYLNLDYNISESKKKIADIFQRLNVLNIEDSIFELKTMVDYFDSIYQDFDKERISKKNFEDLSRTILIKISKLSKINDALLKKLKDIKYSYDLSEEEVSVVYVIKDELVNEHKEYDSLISEHRSKTSSYSHLGKQMELLNIKVGKTEEKLDFALRSLGSLKEDEIRAREQLDEMKTILNQAKKQIRSYKLPVIPENYFVELAEATEAIQNLVEELEKTPISIKALNIRVDTSRDLVLKVYNTTKEVVKTARMAEMTIVYGNRYRPIKEEINIGLTRAENFFFQGDFKKALENAINAVNIIEPGIHKKLLDEYQE